MPWGRISIGDPIWMKWSGGPVVARATVQGFRQIENCSPDQLRQTVAGFKLHGLDTYWQALGPRFSAVTVYLEREEWLDPIFTPAGRSRGESWIVVDSAELEAAWLRPGGGERGAPASPAGPKRGSRTIPLALRFEVLRRDGFRCTYCGRRTPEVVLHIDHAVPWAAGGRTVLENLRVACSDCNLGKGARQL